MVGRQRKEITDSYVDLGMIDGRHKIRCRDCGTEIEAFRRDAHVQTCKQINPQELYAELSDNTCKLCDRSFTTIGNARKHFRKFHIIDPTPNTSATHPNVPTDAINTESIVQQQLPVYIVVDTNIYMKYLHTIAALLARGT